MICAVLLWLILSSDPLQAKIYDLKHSNPPILSEQAINDQLATFERVPFKRIPETLKAHTAMSSYPHIYNAMTFFRLKPSDLFQKIVGDIRIKDFVSSDLLSRKGLALSDGYIYWGINPAILHKLLELKSHMEQQNLNWNAIQVNSGHRTPNHNQKVRGASKSRHLHGDALDLKIGDVNGDHRITAEDKKRVLEICEDYIIQDKGGVGRYPGTMIIHIDTRGKKARWDSF